MLQDLKYPEEITNSGSSENVQRIIDFLGRDKVQEIIYDSHSKMNLCNNLGININSKLNVIKYLKDMNFDITYKNPFERKSTLIDNFTFDELQEKLNTSNHWLDFCKSLGYRDKTSEIISKIRNMGLDTSHLDNYDSSTRFYEKEELESLIKKSSLWQKLYRYYRCRSNKEINNLKGYIEKYNIDTSHLKNKTAREIINSCSDKELEDLISTCRGWNQKVRVFS